MKPKTFIYNQIIQFFQENRLPLSDKQMVLIGIKVKEEMIKLEEYRAKKKAKADKRFIEREHKKQLGYSRIGRNNV